MLTSSVFLQQGMLKYAKKNSMKKVNINENLHIFWTTWEISLKLSGKMWLVIKLNVTESTSYRSLLLKNSFWTKPQCKDGSNWSSRLLGSIVFKYRWRIYNCQFNRNWVFWLWLKYIKYDYFTQSHPVWDSQQGKLWKVWTAYFKINFQAS